MGWRRSQKKNQVQKKKNKKSGKSAPKPRSKKY